MMDAPLFVDLYRKHRHRLFRRIAGLLATQAEAEEIVQDAFLTAWARREKYDPKRPFAPWITTIAKYAAFNLKKRWIPPGPPSSKELEQPDVSAGLRQWWKLLPPAEQELFELYYFEGLTTRKLGERYGVPHQAVEYRLKKLKTKLAEFI